MKAKHRKEIEENVREIVGDHFGIPPFRLNLETDILKDLGADELDRRELIITVEEHCGVKISDDVSSNIERIMDIIEAVEIASSTAFRRTRHPR